MNDGTLHNKNKLNNIQLNGKLIRRLHDQLQLGILELKG